MSTTDQPESGENSRDTNQPPVTTSPQDQQTTAPTTELQPQPDLSADTSIPSAHDQTPANQTQVHPATGPSSGESESAPVTTSPTDPSQTVDNAPVALAQPTTPPSMETEEPKTAPETSTEHSDDGSGKEVEEDAGPSLAITLLLTTGSRHPFTIDRKYLRKRSVNVENFDPFLMSVYTLKELIWREWRSGKSFTPYLDIYIGIGCQNIRWCEMLWDDTRKTNDVVPDWETRPSSPSSIRLISFGKLLDDKSPISGMILSSLHRCYDYRL